MPQPSHWLDPRVFEALRRGKVIAYPTDTVWGLGCNPHSAEAVQNLLALKGRKAEQGLIVIASHSKDLRDWIDQRWRTWLQEQATSKPTTFVLPCLPLTPAWLTGGRSTLAVRLVRSGVAKRLCDRAGALVSTSANRHGQPVLRHPWQLRLTFGRDLGWLLPGHPGGEQPSRIVDAKTGRIIRE